MNQIKIHRKKVQLKEIDLFYLDTLTPDALPIICLHGRWV